MWTLQRSVTVSCGGLHTESNRRGTLKQNFYPGIGLFLGSQQRETGQLVSVGQFFSHTATLHITEGTHTHRKPQSTRRESEKEKERNTDNAC